MLFSRIDISHILSFHFISFKRTSTTMFSSILFSTHLVFFSSLSTSSLSLSCEAVFFAVVAVVVRPKQESVFREREREIQACMHMHAIIVVRCCLSQRCHCFDHVVFLLVLVLMSSTTTVVIVNLTVFSFAASVLVRLMFFCFFSLLPLSTAKYCK